MEGGMSDIHFALSDSIVSGLNRGQRENLDIRKFQYNDGHGDNDVFKGNETSLDDENNNFGMAEDLEIRKNRRKKNIKNKNNNNNVNSKINNNNNNNNGQENCAENDIMRHEDNINRIHSVDFITEDLEIRNYSCHMKNNKNKNDDVTNNENIDIN